MELHKHITYHHNIEQGSEQWLELRRGILTASEVKHILTAKTLKFAQNDKSRTHIYELASQRITGEVLPSYISEDMVCGMIDEVYARDLYSEHYAEVTEVGFITNDVLGFIIGYSPDGIVGDDGLIEVKSRLPKYQIETIITNEVPDEYMLQLQTALLVTGRKWIDFISYCGGLPMFVKRVLPDEKVRDAIIAAACDCEKQIQEKIAAYSSNAAQFIMTEKRTEETEIVV